MTSLYRHLIYWFSSFLLALLLVTPALAQQPITFQYFYDELGQLVKVVDSEGNVVEYVYDEVGNMLEIKRSVTSGFDIFQFTPSRGPVGTTVTILGQGFSADPSENAVVFNGTPAVVDAATVTTLVTLVPLGATTGPISVTVGSQTATSSQNFTVTLAPIITSVTPFAVFAGMTIPDLQVSGLNLTDATFFFSPEFILPEGISIDAVSIDPSGTAASLSVTIGTNANGPFVLVANTPNGSSSLSPTGGNTLSVVGLGTENDDTDGDGFPNGLEVLLGSDPFDPNSIPDPSAQVDEAVSPMFSVGNQGNPSAPALPDEAISPIFSIENLGTP